MKPGQGKVAVLGNGRRPPRTPTVGKRLAACQVAVPHPRRVAAYLKAHPRLARLLPEICAEARVTLGKHVELSLEVYNDPEIDDRYLTLYVRRSGYDAGLIEQIDALREQTNPRLEAVQGYLLIMTDFRRPGTRHAF